MNIYIQCVYIKPKKKPKTITASVWLSRKPKSAIKQSRTEIKLLKAGANTPRLYDWQLIYSRMYSGQSQYN